MSNQAWVTLATNDSYSLGALVLAHSLRRVGSAFPAVVLITPSVTEAMRERLRAVFAEVVVVNVLDSGDAAHLALLQRPELGITFTKIHCWNLTQYEKCVFLDADTLVIQNCDELFEREELSAAPDVGWPDCFNSGVFVFKPSAETFSNLITFASERGSFDGGDQGLLNSYFSDWAHGDINKHLPFLYNVTSAAFYSYLPALKHFGQNLKIIHFIGAIKPWLQQFNWQSRTVEAPEHLRNFMQQWWDLFVADVHTQLDTTMDFTVRDRKYLAIPFIKSSKSIHSHISLRSHKYNMCSKQTPPESNVDEETGVAGNLARVVPGAPLQREAVDELTRRQGWEAGNIDYMGADSFDNIWAKISQTLNQPSTNQTEQPTESAPQQISEPVVVETKMDVVEAVAEQQSVLPTPEKEDSAPNTEEKKIEVASVKSEVPKKVETEVFKPLESEVPKVVETEVSKQLESEEHKLEQSEVPKPAESEVLKTAESQVTKPAESEVPKSEVVASEPAVTIPEKVSTPEGLEKVEVPVPASEAAEVSSKTEEPIPIPAEIAAEVPATVDPVVPVETSSPSDEKEKPAQADIPIAALEALKIDEPLTEAAIPAPVAEQPLVAEANVPTTPPAEPKPVAEAAVEAATPDKSATTPEVGTDSPPLIQTPSKDGAPVVPAAKCPNRACSLM